MHCFICGRARIVAHYPQILYNSRHKAIQLCECFFEKPVHLLNSKRHTITLHKNSKKLFDIIITVVSNLPKFQQKRSDFFDRSKFFIIFSVVTAFILGSNFFYLTKNANKTAIVAKRYFHRDVLNPA